MKILVTGFTDAHVGRPGKPRRETAINLFVRALRELNHEVVQRGAPPGEPEAFAGINLLIAGITPPLADGAPYAFEALGALGHAWASGIPVCLFCDDYRYAVAVRQWKTCAADPSRLLTGKQAEGRHSAEWASGIARKALETVIATLGSGKDDGWPPVIVPRFGWGRDGKQAAGRQLPASRLIHLDPTSMITTYVIDRVPDEQRERAWILGTMTDQWKWLDERRLTWDSRYYGGPGASPNANGSLPEDELVASYGRSWGVLAPRHPNLDGTGCWRARYVHSAMARSVLLAEPRECTQLGEPYTGAMPNLELVETATPVQLRNLAEAQADALRAGCWPHDQLLSELERELKGLTE